MRVPIRNRFGFERRVSQCVAVPATALALVAGRWRMLVSLFWLALATLLLALATFEIFGYDPFIAGLLALGTICEWVGLGDSILGCIGEVFLGLAVVVTAWQLQEWQAQNVWLE